MAGISAPTEYGVNWSTYAPADPFAVPAPAVETPAETATPSEPALPESTSPAQVSSAASIPVPPPPVVVASNTAASVVDSFPLGDTVTMAAPDQTLGSGLAPYPLATAIKKQYSDIKYFNTDQNLSEGAVLSRRAEEVLRQGVSDSKAATTLADMKNQIDRLMAPRFEANREAIRQQMNSELEQQKPHSNEPLKDFAIGTMLSFSDSLVSTAGSAMKGINFIGCLAEGSARASWTALSSSAQQLARGKGIDGTRTFVEAQNAFYQPAEGAYERHQAIDTWVNTTNSDNRLSNETFHQVNLDSDAARLGGMIGTFGSMILGGGGLIRGAAKLKSMANLADDAVVTLPKALSSTPWKGIQLLPAGLGNSGTNLINGAVRYGDDLAKIAAENGLAKAGVTLTRDAFGTFGKAGKAIISEGYQSISTGMKTVKPFVMPAISTTALLGVSTLAGSTLFPHLSEDKLKPGKEPVTADNVRDIYARLTLNPDYLSTLYERKGLGFGEGLAADGKLQRQVNPATGEVVNFRHVPRDMYEAMCDSFATKVDVNGYPTLNETITVDGNEEQIFVQIRPPDRDMGFQGPQLTIAPSNRNGEQGQAYKIYASLLPGLEITSNFSFNQPTALPVSSSTGFVLNPSAKSLLEIGKTFLHFYTQRDQAHLADLRIFAGTGSEAIQTYDGNGWKSDAQGFAGRGYFQAGEQERTYVADLTLNNLEASNFFRDRKSYYTEGGLTLGFVDKGTSYSLTAEGEGYYGDTQLGAQSIRGEKDPFKLINAGLDFFALRTTTDVPEYLQKEFFGNTKRSPTFTADTNESKQYSWKPIYNISSPIVSPYNSDGLPGLSLNLKDKEETSGNA